MPDISRRKFLTAGGAAVAIGGVAAAVPGLHSALESSPSSSHDNEAPLSAAETDAAGKVPVVAVTDPGSGKVILYHGENQVDFNDPSLTAKLYRTVTK